MEIDAIPERIEPVYIFDVPNEKICWNGRDVQDLKGMSFSTILRVFSTTCETNCLPGGGQRSHIKPKMSRPPDESQASIEGGYDDERGVFVEGKWTWTWKDRDDKENSSENPKGGVASDPPDSRDRDFDKM